MIELRGVDAGYGKEVRVHGLDVQFRKGELTAIVGPNGSGKSTMIKSVVGLCHIFSGKVLVQGEEVGTLGSKKLATLVSYLPQNRNLPAITAQKMVLHGRFPYQSYPRHYTDEDRQYVRDAMEKPVSYTHLMRIPFSFALAISSSISASVPKIGSIS